MTEAPWHFRKHWLPNESAPPPPNTVKGLVKVEKPGRGSSGLSFKHCDDKSVQRFLQRFLEVLGPPGSHTTPQNSIQERNVGQKWQDISQCPESTGLRIPPLSTAVSRWLLSSVLPDLLLLQGQSGGFSSWLISWGKYTRYPEHGR